MTTLTQNKEVAIKTTDKLILKSCSKGRALQGLYFTKDLQDVLKDRKFLIEVPEKVELTRASLGDHVKETFSSVDEENTFMKKLEVFGHKTVASASFPAYGPVSIEASMSYSSKNTEEKTSDKKQKTTYSSTVKSSYLEVASCTLDSHDFKLSKNATTELTELMSIIEGHGKHSENAKKKCKQFFTSYGSHAVAGQNFFGGYFLSTCITTGFEESERDTVKNIQEDAVSSKLGGKCGDFGGSVELSGEKLNEVFQSSESKHLHSSTKLHVQIKGGPPNATDVDEWGKGLVSDSNTWVLIDRGKELVAVWDIIKKNHPDEFGELAEVLSKSWEDLTGFKAEKDLLGLKYKPHNVLTQIQEWNNSRSDSAGTISDMIKFQKNVKDDITQTTHSTCYWVSKYLRNSIIQQFLLTVSDSKGSFSHQLLMKQKMQELVTQDELKQIDTLTFPKVLEFTEWLYSRDGSKDKKEDIADFSSFLACLKAIEAKAKKPGFEMSPENIAEEVESAISRLRKNYYEMYEDIALNIFLFSYQDYTSDSYIRLKPLSELKLMELQEELKEEEDKFKTMKGNEVPYLCYFIQQIIECPRLNTLDTFFKKVWGMISKSKPSLDKSLLDQFKRFLLTPASRPEFNRWLMSQLKYSSSDAHFKDQHDTSKSVETLLLQISRKKSVNVATENLHLEKNTCVADFLERIGLLQYYPKTLSLQDALHIRKTILDLSLSGTYPKTLQEVPFLLLHKLMSYDPKCLTDLRQTDIKEKDLPTSKKKKKDFPDDSDDDSVPDSNDDRVPGSNGDSIHGSNDDSVPDSGEEIKKVEPAEVSETTHPIDCLLALLICSDDFLCQDLYSKLAKCQRAIPFAIPNPFTKKLMLSLWSMQSIIYDWKLAFEGKTSKQTHQVVNYPMPIVTFLRMGSEKKSISKSKLLNEVISESEQSYNYFFHRNCSGGSLKRVLGEGLVDMFWYLPNGKKTDLFPNAIAFFNLHGDARDHPKQMELLSSMSSMCFILVTEKNIQFDSIKKSITKLCTSPDRTQFLADTNQKNIKKTLSNYSVINLMSQTDFEVIKTVREEINSAFTSFTGVKCLASHVKDNSPITTDEEFEPYKVGKLQANEVVDHVLNFKGNKHNMKQELLPLQGEHYWRKWANKEKELYRQTLRGNQSVQEYQDKIRIEQSEVRSDQHKHINSLTPITAAFIRELLHLEGPENRPFRNYFLQCLKLELNNLSQKSTSKVYEDYRSVRLKLASLVNNEETTHEEKTPQRVTLRESLKILGEEIINSSIGLEHLLREVGQIYEAAQSKKEMKCISRLPKAVAELLVDGYPLELMDGDAAHVPLQWVSAVLEEAAELLNDPQVFVISVLGIQSTGKSTMMNTTFGVQFNVSAGRCTRGAYMQLLLLDEEIKKATKCSYVLIVDTEGLRALELDPEKTQKHDNELATFVIGLANVTLINIYGEVPGEMDNILQTSVHAFLRMSKIKYPRSCHFVHQNASENAKSEVGREHFLAKLNKFTRIAAEEESCERDYECFNDVIQFDDQTDVHHFPGLWRGDPPMAPVNQGYSTAAQQLKLSIIKCICNRAGQGDLSLRSFQQRMKDLWKALLNETFIFSFKNTLEIRAYKKMEEVYGDCHWSFRQSLLEWEHKAVNRIKSEPEATMSELKEKLKKELQDLIQLKHSHFQKTMEQYFRGKDADILKDWKGSFENKLEMLSKKLEQHAQDHCDKLFRSKIEVTKFKKDQEQAENSAGNIKDEVLKDCMLFKGKQEKLLECIKNGRLESEQLKELLKLNLFSDEKLAKYEEDSIVTSDQIDNIKTVITSNGMTKTSLEVILTGETLCYLDVQRILVYQEAESELQKKFDEIWDNQTCHLRGMNRHINVEGEMDNALIEFDANYSGKLRPKLRECPLSKRIDKRNFIPSGEQHYTNEGGIIFNIRKLDFFVNFLTGSRNSSSEKAEKVTRNILEKVYSEIDKITENKTDSIEDCTIKLLKYLRKEIKNQPKEIKKTISFKPEYEIELQLIVCSHALPTFKNMAELAREKLDPLYYLKKFEYKPLLTTFQNLYMQVKAENSIADTICAYLEEPTKMRRDQSLPHLLANKMRLSQYHYFSSKMALKVQVLTDLHKEDKFEKYMSYIHDPGQCLENYLVQYIAQYCDNESESATRLQVITKLEICRIIEVVVNVMKSIKTGKAIDWLSKLLSDTTFREELVVKQTASEILRACNSSHKLDLENFQKTMESSLLKLKSNLQQSHMISNREKQIWKNATLDHLKDLVGCQEQCPFCYEQCDLQIPNHDQKHRVEVHRIGCCGGRRMKETKLLSMNYCPNMIAEDWDFYKDDIPHPYKKYAEIYPDWSIPSGKSDESLYWKLFIGKYIDKLVETYGKGKPVINPSWKDIPWQNVEEDLKKIHHL